jgi:zinc protease
MLRPALTVLILALGLLDAQGAQQAGARPPLRVTSVEGITEYRLANGLRVLLFPDPSRPTTTVNITYLVGSRHESYGETGMAHLLEHMAFKGTLKRHPRPQDVTGLLNELGGDFNGSTYYDRTNYNVSFTASDENLRKALDLEADRMVNSRIAKVDLDTEFSVVRNEFEMGENDPERVTTQRVQAVAFDWHNYGKPTIGARSDIEHVRIERLQAFYRKYYQPDNAVLMVAGRIDPGKTLRMVGELFGPIPRPTRKLEKTYTVEPVQDGERGVVVRRTGGNPLLVALYHICAGSHDDGAPLAILGQVLGDEPSGRLYKALVVPKLATRVGLYPASLQENSFLQVTVELPRDGDPERARSVLLQVLEEFGKQPVTSEEVDRAKVQFQKSIELALSDTKRLCLDLTESIAQGDWRLFFKDRDRIAATAPADVDRVAGNYLRPSNRTLGQYVPTETPSRTQLPDVPDVQALLAGYRGRALVAQGEAFDASPAHVAQRTLRFTAPGGLQGALLAKRTKGEKVAASLLFRFGQEETLRGKAILASVMGDMLLRGTGQHTRQQLQDALDGLKAQVEVRTSGAAVEVTLTTVKASLPAVLRLVGELVREPAFPASELETLVQQQITALEGSLSEPMTLAQEFLAETTDPYPAGHYRAYLSPARRMEALRGVRVEALRAFHADFLGAGAALFSCVGDFDPAPIQALVTDLFGAWKSPQPYLRIPQARRELASLQKTLETPDKQMALFLAHQGWAMRDGDPDYPAFLMANHILGGGMMRNRLADRLRQKEGFSYSVGSNFTALPLDPVARWTGFAILAPQNMAKLETAFKEEVERALREGFTQAELDFARKAWLEAERGARQEDAPLADWLVTSLILGRPILWQEELEAKVRALDLAQVHRALRTYLDPARFVIVKAGDLRTR